MRRLRSWVQEILHDRTYMEWWWAYLFLAVDLAWSSVFLFYPIVKTIVFSLQDLNLSTVDAPPFTGLANYATLLRDTRGFWHSVRVSVIYTLGVVPVGVGISLLLALLIVPLGKRAQDFYKAAFYLPGVVSGVVIALVFRWIFFPSSGLANWILERLGLEGQGWYADPGLALFTLIAISWLGSHGWGVLLYTAALQRIPKSLYEAAEIDATPGWRRLTRITLPLVKPVTLYVTVTSMINSLQSFWGAFFITRGGPLRTTEFLTYRIYRTFYFEGDYGLAAAQSVLLMIVIGTIAAVNFKMFGKGVEY